MTDLFAVLDDRPQAAWERFDGERVMGRYIGPSAVLPGYVEVEPRPGFTLTIREEDVEILK